jgi:hypothetical protein
MPHNRTFWKAFHSLVHPLSLMAILLLLFNDHWLRYAHPSWLTGKLGDFTWLVFAPFITALLLAWIIPQRWKQHSRIVGLLSIGFIGVWFATAKTIPFVHEITTQTLYAIVGWEGQLRLDVTDLLTLPALLISWHIWNQASDDSVSLKPLAYVAFGLGILGTLATDDGPYYSDMGVSQICSYEGLPAVVTQDMWGNGAQYQSTNGGLFWNLVDTTNFNGEGDSTIQDNTLCDDIPLTTNSFLIHWTPQEQIEISTDGGDTWAIDYDLAYLRQDVRNVYVKYGYDDYNYLIQNMPSPMDAYYDEDSGNIIFAMSWNGVLVRDANGEYTWVTVGDYGLENLANFQKATDAIFFELWLALATCFLIVTTSTRYIRRQQRSIILKILIVISWAGYVGILALLLADRGYDMYLTPFSQTSFASFVMLILFGIPLSIGATWDILNNFRAVALQIMLAGIGTGALFIFPFLLWTQGRIPRYATVYALSVFLLLIGLYTSWVYLKRILPIVEFEPEKMKNDAIEKNKTSDDA